MKILVGKNAGFCYGVKRAVDGAKEELVVANKNNKIYCLGEIVHNKDVVKSLENEGIEFIEDISKAKGTTIIRAHGIPKEVYKKAEELHISIKDYTCPKVIKIHEIALKYAQEGFFIMLTGSKKHPENIGTMSFCGENYYVIEDDEKVEEAIKQFNKTGINKLLLISQTTFSVEKFKNIETKIQELINLNTVKLVVKNTICAATKIRQEEVAELAKQVDKMIIVGGKNSSNTKKLFEIAKKYCDITVCVENEKDLDVKLFNKNDVVGIMAGASTPQESIENVKTLLMK